MLRFLLLTALGGAFAVPAEALEYEDCLPALEAVTQARKANAGPNATFERARKEAWDNLGRRANAEVARTMAKAKARQKRLETEAEAAFEAARRANYAAYNRATTDEQRLALKKEMSEHSQARFKAISRANTEYFAIERKARGDAERQARAEYKRAREAANRAHAKATVGVMATLVKALEVAWPGPDNEHPIDKRRRLEASLVECETKYRWRFRR